MPPIHPHVEETCRVFRKAAVRALNEGNSALAMATARKYREYLTDAAAYGAASQEFVRAGLEVTRSLVVRDLGTVAWDEPETVEEGLARMGTLPEAPGAAVAVKFDRDEEAFRYQSMPTLTDEHLAKIWSRWSQHDDRGEDVRALLVEIKRLRSEEWLEKAAEEISVRFVRREAWEPAPTERERKFCEEIGRIIDEHMAPIPPEEAAARFDAAMRKTDEILVRAILRKHRDGKA